MMLITASVWADNDVKVLLKTPQHSASKKRNDATTNNRSKSYSDGSEHVEASDHNSLTN